MVAIGVHVRKDFSILSMLVLLYSFLFLHVQISFESPTVGLMQIFICAYECSGDN